MKILIALVLLFSLLVMTYGQPMGSEISAYRKVIYTSLDSEVRDISLNPTGDTLAIADGNKVVIFDLKTEEKQMILDANSQIYALAWDSTGDRLAAFAACGPYIWNLVTGEEPKTQFEYRKPVPCSEFGAIAWSPDNEFIAGGIRQTVFYVWDAETGEQVHRMAYHRNVPLADLSWSPDGNWLASVAIRDGKIRIWNMNKPEESIRLDCEGCRAFSLAWSPDGSMLAASGDNIGGADVVKNSVWVWDMNSYELLSNFSFQNVTHGFAWAADSEKLLTTYGEIWTVAGEKVGALDLRLTGYPAWVDWKSEQGIAVIAYWDRVLLFHNLTP